MSLLAILTLKITLTCRIICISFVAKTLAVLAGQPVIIMQIKSALAYFQFQLQ